MKANNWVIALSDILGRVPSLVYALIYLGLIPIFALIYWLLPPHQFFHSTVQYESYLRRDARDILDGLQSAIKDNFIEMIGSLVTTYGGWRFDMVDTSFSNLEVKKGKFRFMLYAKFVSPGMTQQLPIDLRFSLDHPLNENEEQGKQMFWLCEEDRDQPKTPIKFSVLFPFNPRFSCGTCVSTGDGDCGFIVIPTHLRNRLVAYDDAMNGFPSLSSGSFNRMFYLSAITITTVGYGDIVPITPVARIAVAIEAILGVVLVGLFLNALAHEYNRSNA